MRGEPNKKWNKRITKPCPVCGGRVIVANRGWSWWIRCDNDPFHIKYKSYGDPYSAIRAFNAQTNADRIRAMTDEELAKWMAYDVIGPRNNKSFEDTKALCLEWLKEEVDNERI